MLDDLVVGYARKGWRGTDRLIDLVGYNATKTLKARTSFGTHMMLHPRSYIDSIVMREGYYETEVAEAVLDQLDDGGVFWDVGANIGLHAITAKAKRPGATVACFEPSVGILGRLWNNIEANRLDIQVFNLALSNRAGFATLNIAVEGNSGMSSLLTFEELRHSYHSCATVALATGDQLIGDGLLATPTVVKIDVEGHELEVLEGMRNALANPACKAVIFEDHRVDDSPAKAFLRSVGFTVAPLRRQEASAHNLENYVARRAA